MMTTTSSATVAVTLGRRVGRNDGRRARVERGRGGAVAPRRSREAVSVRASTRRDEGRRVGGGSAARAAKTRGRRRREG